MRITLQWLMKWHACERQLLQAINTFGLYALWNGITITRENLRIAYENKLDLNWLRATIGVDYDLPDGVGVSIDGACNCDDCRAERAGLNYAVEALLKYAATEESEKPIDK